MILFKFRAVGGPLLWEALGHGLLGLGLKRALASQVVKQAICRLKPDKEDVTGSYSSNEILNGPDFLFERLADVSRSFFTLVTVTKSLLACAFIPILKPLKGPVKCTHTGQLLGPA